MTPGRCWGWEFELHLPSPRLADLLVTPALAGVGSVDLQTTGPGLWHVAFTASPGGTISGDGELAWLGFTAAVGEHSIVLPISVEGLQGRRSNGELVSRSQREEGRIWLVAREPLVDLGPDPENGLTLTVFGHPGRHYRVESAVEVLVPAEWRPYATFQLDGELRQIPVTAAVGGAFYRAYELAASPLSAAAWLEIRRTRAGVRLEWPREVGEMRLESTELLGPESVWTPVKSGMTPEAGA